MGEGMEASIAGERSWLAVWKHGFQACMRPREAGGHRQPGSPTVLGRQEGGPAQAGFRLLISTLHLVHHVCSLQEACLHLQASLWGQAPWQVIPAAVHSAGSTLRSK